MIELSCGKENMTICRVVSIEYRNMTDRRTYRIAISVRKCEYVLTTVKERMCSVQSYKP